MDANIYGIQNIGGLWKDCQLNNISLHSNTPIWKQLQEGDFFYDGIAWTPILRERAMFLGIRSAGSSMKIIFNRNDTLKNNPTIVIIGSSHAISMGLSGSQTLQFKIEAYCNANWGGATIINLGVAGEYTDHWLPTTMGGLPDRNVDAALSYDPDIVLIIGPTNDAQFNTPAQATANLLIITTYLRQHGAFPFVHSPLPRGSYGAADQTDLKDSNILWADAFPYNYFSLFNSVLRDSTAPTDGAPNPFYYQGDQTHLNDAGTTVEVDEVMPKMEAELKALTAFKNVLVERSTVSPSTGFVTFDTITNMNLISKTYTKTSGFFRVSAQLKDNSWMPLSNVIEVTNIVPTVDAGGPITRPTGSVTANITGAASDPDGTIVSVLWTQISGPSATLVNANTLNLTVNGISDGNAYGFRLTATDNNGGVSFSDMVLTVTAASNVAPTANAGVPTDYNLGTVSFSLSGSGSDIDGTIAAYAWTQQSGPNTASITSPSLAITGVTGAVGGVYVFRLTVTDNLGLTGFSDVRIRIVSALAKFNFSKEAYSVAGYNNAFGDPTNNNATAFVVDPATGWRVGARAASNWNSSVGGENSKNGWGATVDDGGGFAFSPNDAIVNYWYNVNDFFDGTKYQALISDLDASKQYRITTIASRSNANGATGPYSTAFNLLTFTGNKQVITTNTYQNTSKIAIFPDETPLLGGSFQLALHRGASGSAAHLNALLVEQF